MTWDRHHAVAGPQGRPRLTPPAADRIGRTELTRLPEQRDSSWRVIRGKCARLR